MKKVELGNGHTIEVEPANRGIKNDYKIAFYEENRFLMIEYYDKDCAEIEFGIKL